MSKNKHEHEKQAEEVVNEQTEAAENREKEAERAADTEDGKNKSQSKQQKKSDSKLTAENAELKRKLEESEKKAEEYKQSWYRSAAEFDNYKKRHANERSQAYTDGQGDVIKSILVIGDNLERALCSVPDEKTAEGIKMMIRQFYETLANLNVKVVDPVGETFDPNLHEAVHQVEPEEGDESGKIKSVFRKGYELNGKILRYAQVVVIK